MHGTFELHGCKIEILYQSTTSRFGMDFTMKLVMLMKLKVSVSKLCIEVYEDSVVDYCECEVIMRNKFLGFGRALLDKFVLRYWLTRCGCKLLMFVIR